MDCKMFLFLTELAWKNRLTIPVLVFTAFILMDLRMEVGPRMTIITVRSPTLG